MATGHDAHHHGPASGITRWFYTTNHKDIGSMYLWFSFAMFLLGGMFALVIRAELFQPGLQFVDPNFFNHTRRRRERSSASENERHNRRRFLHVVVRQCNGWI